MTVATPAQATQNLITAIATMGLPAEIVKSLSAPLGQASALLNDTNPNNDVGACGKLDAFIKQVQAESGKKLTVFQASTLIASANQVRGALGCS